MVRKVTPPTDETEAEQSSDDDRIPSVETLLCDEAAVPDSLEEPVPRPGSPALPGIRAVDWQ